MAKRVSLLFTVETTLGKVLSHGKTQLDGLIEPTCGGGNGLHINTQNGKRFAYDWRNAKSAAIIKTKHSDMCTQFMYKSTPSYTRSICIQRETLLFALSPSISHKNTLFQSHKLLWQNIYWNHANLQCFMGCFYLSTAVLLLLSCICASKEMLDIYIWVTLTADTLCLQCIHFFQITLKKA